jgi:hypothetical protein
MREWAKSGWMAMLAIACLVGVITAHAQTAAEWDAQQEAAGRKADQIMTQATQHQGLLAQFLVMRQAFDSDHSRAFQLIFGQYISWYLSFAGDYPNAMRTFSVAQPAQSDDNLSPLDARGGYTAQPAIDAIPALAKNYRIVLLNEAHNIALTRSLTVPLLSRLRQEGFDYFAAETLSSTDTELSARGYPTEHSGFYTEEPIYAEMVRTALKLGFKVIAYEANDTTGNTDVRETEQARNLYQQVFAKDPAAKLVINAGYDHIVKSGPYLDGSSMAEHLYQLTHLPMLSIDQTMLYPRPSSDRDHPYYTAVMKALRPSSPIVFMRADGTPWTLRSNYDVSVFFPPENIERGRPTWLSLGGLRIPHYITADHCQGHYPCLVEAYYSDEGDDAIPADRLILNLASAVDTGAHIPVYTSNQDTPSADLYLRPGKYRVVFSSGNGHVLHRENIVVTDASP